MLYINVQYTAQLHFDAKTRKYWPGLTRPLKYKCGRLPVVGVKYECQPSKSSKKPSLWGTDDQSKPAKPQVQSFLFCPRYKSNTQKGYIVLVQIVLNTK